MSEAPPLILIVQYAGNRGGSAISGRLVLEGIAQKGWKVSTIFGFYGTYSDQYSTPESEIYLVPHQWIGARTIKRSLRKHISAANAVIRFYFLYLKLKPSVIYINTLVSVPAALAARLAGIPLIWHVRELFEDDHGELVIPRLGGKGFISLLLTKLPRFVVVNSKVVLTNVMGENTPPRYSVIPNAVSEDYLQFTKPRVLLRRDLGLPEDVKVIGVPGTLREVKGHAFFLDSISEILKRRVDLLVIISGDVAVGYFDVLRKVAEKMSIGDKIRFLGNMEDMRQFYRACDFVCIPSKSETFGRTVIEAFMSGTPVIATSVGGIREIVEHEVTGLLVDYGDCEGMQAAICRMIEDEGFGEMLARNAKIKAEDQYTETTYKNRITGLIEELLVGG